MRHLLDQVFRVEVEEIPIKYMKLCLSCQICDEALQSCQKPTITLPSHQQDLITSKAAHTYSYLAAMAGLASSSP